MANGAIFLAAEYECLFHWTSLFSRRGFDCIQQYSIYADRLEIGTLLTARGFNKCCVPLTLPRLGYEFAVPETANEILWLGRGPERATLTRKNPRK